MIGFASTASAQWSDDAAANLAVADPTGDQVQNKIIASPGGGYYVSWFDNRTGGFDVYLQHFDAQGVAQLADDGVRQWGDEGVVVTALTNTEVGFPRVVHQDGGATVF